MPHNFIRFPPTKSPQEWKRNEVKQVVEDCGGRLEHFWHERGGQHAYVLADDGDGPCMKRGLRGDMLVELDEAN